MSDPKIKDWGSFYKITMLLESKIEKKEGMDAYDLKDIYNRLVEDFTNYAETKNEEGAKKWNTKL